MNCPRFIQGKQTIWNLHSEKSGASLCFLFSFQVHLSTSDALHRVAVKWMLGYVGMQGGTSLVLPVLPFQFFLPLLDNAPWIRLRNSNSKLERSALQWCHKQDGVLTSKIVNIQQHCNFHGESDDSMWDMWVWGACSLWTNPWSVCRARFYASIGTLTTLTGQSIFFCRHVDKECIYIYVDVILHWYPMQIHAFANSTFIWFIQKCVCV